MKNVNYRSVLLLLSAGIISSVLSCAPRKYNSTVKNNKNTELDQKQEIIDQDLSTTTAKYESLTPQTASRYEAPERIIKNKKSNAEVIVGQLKLSNPKFNYNPNTRKLQVSGHAEIISEDKKNSLGSTDFSLLGSHAPHKGVFALRPPGDNKKNNSEIQVRAKVTCLDFDRDDQYDCTRSIIDIFVKQNNKIYTEQLETLGLKKTDQNFTTTADKQETSSVTSSTAQTQSTKVTHDENGLQAEGETHEIKGRYVGTAATTKLDKLFDTINDIIKKKDQDQEQTANNTDDDEDDSDSNNKTESADQTNNFKNNFHIDQSGRMIKRNQAFGDYDGGKLRNASSLVEQQKTLKLENLFEVSFPDRGTFYGTQEMMDIIELIGKKMNQSNDKLYVGNISKMQGGRLPPSVSHQIGMDADLGYPTPQGQVKFPVVVDRQKRLFNTYVYSTQKTYELFKYLVSQNDVVVARIFSDQQIINDLCSYAKRNKEFEGSQAALARKLFNTLSHVDGHGDHFHMRLMCTDNQPACNKVIYPKSNNCQ